MTNDSSTTDASTPTGQTADAGPATTAPAEPVDDLVSTQHQLTLADGSTLDYTAVTGRVVLREEVYEDKTFKGLRPKAEVSVTAYLVDVEDATSRPVTFAFNGGPGSSSVWLHLGVLGPRRVVMGDAGDLLPPPYGITDNAESLLAVSDLVFIDPVSTGYSRTITDTKPGEFHGYTRDIESVAEVIRLWTSRHQRWLSPKFLAGESYGTLRAVALADHLQTRHSMHLNGLMLISSVLDFGTIDLHTNPRNDRAFALYLPTYAAIAFYHGRSQAGSLAEAVAEAEAYASRDYPWVLSRGNRLSEAERAEAVATLARLTGLSEDYVDRAELRIEHWRFFGELLRDERRTTGRLDGRFAGPAASAIAEHMDADPSMDAICGPYASAFNHYVRDELGYSNDLPYEQISSRVRPWSYQEFENRPVDVTDRLERAMRRNPHLKVQIAYGYYDGATPHFAAEDVVAHLNLPAELRENIEHCYYEAGHMMYVHEPSRLQQSADLIDFVNRSSSAG